MPNITLKNFEIINTFNLLKEIAQIEFDWDDAWDIKRNMKKLELEIKTFSECENDLVQKYAIKDEELNVKTDENGQPKFAPNNQDKFKKEQTELLNCSCELDLKKIKCSSIKTKLKDKGIKPSILFDLDFLIEDDIK